jgi:methyl-accepting chemotaxis protein
MSGYKRRNFFIDREYQGRIIMRILQICLAGLVLELTLFNYLSYRNVEEMRWMTHIQADTMGEIVRQYLAYSSVVALLLTGAALFVYIRFIRQKTAGPLYRLQKDLTIAAEGDLSRNIRLGGDDDFRDTAEELDRMISSVRADFRLLGGKMVAVGRTVDLLEYVADRPAVASEKCQQLIEYLEPLRKIKR